MEVHDTFSGSDGVKFRGAFHLGNCKAVTNEENRVEADFGDFIFSIAFPPQCRVEIFRGSNDPFMGWRSTIYGAWEPIYSIVFSSQLATDCRYKCILNVAEK